MLDEIVNEVLSHDKVICESHAVKKEMDRLQYPTSPRTPLICSDVSSTSGVRSDNRLRVKVIDVSSR